MPRYQKCVQRHNQEVCDAICLLIPIPYHDVLNKEVLSSRLLYKHPANNRHKPSHRFFANFTRDEALNKRQETSFAWLQSSDVEIEIEAFQGVKGNLPKKPYSRHFFGLQPRHHEDHIHLPHSDHLRNSSLFASLPPNASKPPPEFFTSPGDNKSGWPMDGESFCCCQKPDKISQIQRGPSQYIRFYRFAFASSFIPFQFNNVTWFQPLISVFWLFVYILYIYTH